MPRAARRFRPAGDETVSSVAAMKERPSKGGLSLVNEDLKHPVSGGVARSAWMAPQERWGRIRLRLSSRNWYLSGWS
jgi:hypothetical protein